MLVVSLSCYKWYQSQTSGDASERRVNLEGGLTPTGVLVKMLGLEEGGLEGPTSIGERNECQ